MSVIDRLRRMLAPNRGLAAADPELSRAAGVFIRRAGRDMYILRIKAAELRGVPLGDWKITVEPIDYDAEVGS